MIKTRLPLATLVLALILFLPQVLTLSAMQWMASPTQWLAGSLALALAWLLLLVSGYGLPGLKLQAIDWLLPALALAMCASWLPNQLHYASLSPLVWWLECVALYLMLRLLLRHPGVPERLVSLILLSGIVLATLYFARRWYPSLIDLVAPFEPFAYDPNTLALLVVLPLFLALYRLFRPGAPIPHQFAYLLQVAAYLLLIHLANSRAAWLAIGIGTVFLCLQFATDRLPDRTGAGLARQLNRHLALLFSLALMLTLLLGLFTLHLWVEQLSELVDGSVEGRLRRWANGMAMVRDNLPFGVGMGNWYDHFERYRHSVVADPGGFTLPFNFYLKLLAEGGVFVFGLFWMIVHALMARPARVRLAYYLKASLLGWLIFALFHVPWLHKYTLFILAIHFALLRFTTRPVLIRPGRLLSGGSLLAATGVLVISGLAYQAVASSANMRAAVLTSYFQYADDGQSRFSYSRQVNTLPAWIRNWLTAVDYRDTSPDSFKFADYTTHGYTGVYAYIGQQEVERGRCDLARPWLKAHLERRTEDGLAWLNLCRCDAIGAANDAEQYCDKAVALLPAHPEPYLYRAQLHIPGAPQQSYRDLVQADRLSARQVGDHEFGENSIVRIDRFVRRAREIDRLRAEIQPHLPPDTRAENHVRLIEKSPLVHKALAVGDNRIYFSSNESGRFNLWKLDRGGGAPEMISNDSRTAFNLQTTPAERQLFFVADQAGDYNYRLYSFDLRSGLTRSIVDTPGIDRYRLSNNGRYLLYTTRQGQFSDISLIDRVARKTQTIAGRVEKIDSIRWAPDDQSVFFVAGRRNVFSYRPAEGKLQQVFSTRQDLVKDISPAPGGERLALLLADYHDRTALNLLNLEGGIESIDLPGTRLVSLHWFKDDKLIYRESQQDRYLLGILDLEQKIGRRIGPDDGVSYQLAFDRGREYAYFIHIPENNPASLVELNLNTLQHRRLHDFFPSPWPPATEVEITTSGARPGSIPVYRYQPETPREGAPIIVWLHGASGGFSPRWHTYAQYFSRSGMHFIAPNVSGGSADKQPGLTPEQLQRLQVGQLHELIQALRSDPQFSHNPVVLIGVSNGTLLAHAYLESHPRGADALIEYAALRPADGIEAGLPRLVFVGANDAYADIGAIRDSFAATDNENSQLTIYPNEGHDLRRQSNIIDRLHSSLAFIEKIGH